MNDNHATNETSPATAEMLTLQHGFGNDLHVGPAAYAEFELAIDASLEALVTRWAPFASPQAQSRNAGMWRR
ncbi:MAG: hypothetical protein WD875_16770 [Pirellulales bacterium]